MSEAQDWWNAPENREKVERFYAEWHKPEATRNRKSALFGKAWVSTVKSDAGKLIALAQSVDREQSVAALIEIRRRRHEDPAFYHRLRRAVINEGTTMDALQTMEINALGPISDAITIFDEVANQIGRISTNENLSLPTITLIVFNQFVSRHHRPPSKRELYRLLDRVTHRALPEGGELDRETLSEIDVSNLSAEDDCGVDEESWRRMRRRVINDLGLGGLPEEN